METPKPGLVDALMAFMLATAVTAITFPLSDRLIGVLSALWRSGFDFSVMSNSWVAYNSKFGFGDMAMVWIIFVVSTAIPYASCIAVVRRFRLVRWYGVVGCGVITAVLGCALCIGGAMLVADFKFGWYSLMVCYYMLVEVLPHCLVFGLVAGSSCWMYFRFKGIEER